MAESTVGVECYQQLDGQFVSLPPASLPPSLTHFLLPSSSSLCAEEHKLSNTSTAAHVSSVLQLSSPCLHTEGSERADGAHGRHARARTHTHAAQVLIANRLLFRLFPHPASLKIACQHKEVYTDQPQR